MIKLPLFPLNTVLFPGAPIHLNIFEQRYRLMLRECIQDNLPFGVCLIRRGAEAFGTLADPYPIGCTARIVHLEPLSDGRINLTAIGDERFIIRSLNDQKSYLVGEVDLMGIIHTDAVNLDESVVHLKPWVEQYLSLLSRLEDEYYDHKRSEVPSDPMQMVYIAASLLQIPPFEKQFILSIPTTYQLFNHLLRLYRRETAVLKYQLKYTNREATRAAVQN